jgi:hypothetical protein
VIVAKVVGYGLLSVIGFIVGFYVIGPALQWPSPGAMVFVVLATGVIIASLVVQRRQHRNRSTEKERGNE